MIAPPKPRHPWIRSLGIYAASGALVVAFATLAGEVASRCQCHYTPALFAQREGLRRVVIDVEVPDAVRDDLVERLEELQVFVDPTYSSGVSSTLAVFARADQKEEVVRVARTFSPR